MEITTTITSEQIDILISKLRIFELEHRMSPAQLDMVVIAALTAIHFFNGSQGVKIGKNQTLADLKVRKQ